MNYPAMNCQAEASWFPLCRAAASAGPALDADAVQLFCLPHAGAGASVYRDWPDRLAPAIEVVPVQLPGRESRYREPLHRSVSGLAEALIEPLAKNAKPRFALFGHSMGALLGYELSHALCDLGRPPAHLFASGLSAPHVPPVKPPVYRLPDEELLSVISELEGTSREILAQPELLRLLLPVFRADIEVCENYQHPDRPLLRIPLTALGGRRDARVEVDAVLAWGSLTTASFHAVFFEGGHFFLHEELDELAALLTARLELR